MGLFNDTKGGKGKITVKGEKAKEHGGKAVRKEQQKQNPNGFKKSGKW